jgi:Zn-dependent protease
MEILIFLPVLLFSVVVHEVAHALVAKWEGDPTAERLGRITLNPIPHLDLVGSLIVPLVLFFLPGNFIFGWAKPVPVNPNNFRDYRRGDIRVSLAGITANLGLAVLCTVLLGVLLKVGGAGGPQGGPPGGVLGVLQAAAYFGLFINLILAVFNLIPLPPLDGSHVVYHLLPQPLADRYRAMGRYGILILMGLVFFFPGGIRVLLWPVEYLVGLAEGLIRLWL